jgi:hypothetical protein
MDVDAEFQRTDAQRILVVQFHLAEDLALVQICAGTALERAEKVGRAVRLNAAMAILDLSAGRPQLAFRTAANEETRRLDGNERAGPWALGDFQAY